MIFKLKHKYRCVKCCKAQAFKVDLGLRVGVNLYTCFCVKCGWKWFTNVNKYNVVLDKEEI